MFLFWKEGKDVFVLKGMEGCFCFERNGTFVLNQEKKDARIYRIGSNY